MPEARRDDEGPPAGRLALSPITEAAYEAAESPVYDDRENALYFCDILPGMVYRVALADGALKSWRFAGPIGSLGLAESGRLLVAFGHTVALFDTASEKLQTVCEIGAEVPRTRLNDGKVGPDGAFWVGTIHDPPGTLDPERDPLAHTDPLPIPPVRDPIGSFYRVDPGGSVTWLADGYRASNGVAFSPDGRTLYHADTGTGAIDRWRLDPGTGTASGRRPFAMVSEEAGRPDGAAMDVEGCYWSAGVSAGCLNRFAPDGRLVETYPVPLVAPTMLCFGGPDMRTLFVTSLRRRRKRELLWQFPLTGRVLAGPSPVQGFPVARFRD